MDNRFLSSLSCSLQSTLILWMSEFCNENAHTYDWNNKWINEWNAILNEITFVCMWKFFGEKGLWLCQMVKVCVDSCAEAMKWVKIDQYMYICHTYISIWIITNHFVTLLLILPLLAFAFIMLERPNVESLLLTGNRIDWYGWCRDSITTPPYSINLHRSKKSNEKNTDFSPEQQSARTEEKERERISPHIHRFWLKFSFFFLCRNVQSDQFSC